MTHVEFSLLYDFINKINISNTYLKSFLSLNKWSYTIYQYQ